MPDVEERFRNLRSRVDEHVTDPKGEYILWALCDGCGVLVRLEKPELPPGWTTARGDLCPGCSDD